jgi:hypothetical protein
MTAALGEFITEEPPVVVQGHVAWHGEVSAADQPPIREGVMRGATRTGGLKGVGEGHGRYNRGETAGQHRLARSRGAEQEHIMVRTPASASP